LSYHIITGTQDFLESLRGKSASFLLAGSVSKTCEIPHLSQAGIPGKLPLTPTLDAEFITVKQVRSLQHIASTPSGIPTPALITRAVHELKPFQSIEILDLGLEIKPKIEHFKIHEFDLSPSENITQHAHIDAFEVFQKGVAFAQNYEPQADYTILAESVPAGTTTAMATAMALGYETTNCFSSSFKNAPQSLKQQVVQQALEHTTSNMDVFEKLSALSDNMIVFNAGFILGLQATSHKLILAGGTQMASVLLVVNSLLQTMGGELDGSKIALCTTKWIANDETSNIKALLEQLDFTLNAYSADFDFAKSTSEVLKLYDQGEAKEGVGAGGALIYGLINGLEAQSIVKKVEQLLHA
jgi:uncharacterized protein (TIGR00303 family)